MKYFVVFAVVAFLCCSIAVGTVIRHVQFSPITNSLMADEAIKKVQTEFSTQKLSFFKKHLLRKRDATKVNMNTMVISLLKRADETIKILEKQNKTSEIEYIKKEEAIIQNLVKQKQTETNATKLLAIDKDFTIAYSNFSFELHKIELSANDQKAMILEKAIALEKQTESLIKKLKEENRDSEAAILEKEKDWMKQLVIDLQAVKTGAGITVIEHELQMIESRLSIQLKNILDHDIMEEKQKTALLQRAAQIEIQAEAAIKKLKEIKNESDVAILEKEAAVVKDLVTKLNVAKSVAEIYNIMNDLQTAEDKLNLELKMFATQIESKVSAFKQQLVEKATALEKQAEEVIKKLKVLNKNTDVAIIEKDEALIKKLVTDLQAAKTDADVKKIEQELASLETRLNSEIQKVTI